MRQPRIPTYRDSGISTGVTSASRPRPTEESQAARSQSRPDAKAPSTEHRERSADVVRLHHAQTPHRGPEAVAA
ncbi:hypothetical protein NBM05_08305 [Rothia sp. AR01]|uniref:Uncharacterized protein n=1 Tax=Rothia santali TaxID=2949643 RepID=A0A9X2HFW0_9MICC|nr:hypothetical protein [Rothia santali]MCP3426002.1 hypothetical protein [Rothia santali]